MKMRCCLIRLGLTFLAPLVGGCAVGPNYRTPESPTPDQWTASASGSPTSQPALRPPDLAAWWNTLADPLLDTLMTRAVESNLDLRVATARVREARAQRDVATAGFWPQLDLSGSYAYRGSSENAGGGSSISSGALSGGSAALSGAATGGGLPSVSVTPGALVNGSGSPVVTVTPQRVGPFQPGGQSGSVTVQPGSLRVPGGYSPATATLTPPGAGGSGAISRQSNLFQAGFDASWELDVFGGTRRAVEAADADLAASIESRRDVLVTLLSEVALNYVQLRGSQRRRKIADENIAAQEDTLKLTQERYRAGFTNELDVAQAQAQLFTTRSQVPLLESAIRQAIYQLSVLLGQPPMALVAELESAAPIPLLPPDVPLGLPSDLLRRRPDIRSAERSLAGATARIGDATADLFPKFSLTGSFGTQTRDMRYFTDSRSLFWSVGPAVSWPVWDAGRIRANIEVQNAREEQALATYERTVLTAFQDVENALVAYNNEKIRHQALTDAVASNQRSADLSNQLYSRGLIAFLNVLDSQRALYNSQDQLAQSETTTVPT